ncbi:hypothetical protein BDK51DRAFT_36983 [Blyttiomyces helicus]|uniref:Uncharacterized protein n=1 Tax=Blyttiomyces helicus TaxID=388810 RepID=A0A4P9WTR6_9FUNG|nr:hypothetical protein BDK51DRAFT_36983 [Blyttiomyces helicus]|eukprot:RKO94760.1 hypothetical protein BDK51DRAFT_36983 [Blyttiomyces helicus]
MDDPLEDEAMKASAERVNLMQDTADNHSPKDHCPRNHRPEDLATDDAADPGHLDGAPQSICLEDGQPAAAHRSCRTDLHSEETALTATEGSPLTNIHTEESRPILVPIVIPGTALVPELDKSKGKKKASKATKEPETTSMKNKSNQQENVPTDVTIVADEKQEDFRTPHWAARPLLNAADSRAARGRHPKLPGEVQGALLNKAQIDHKGYGESIVDVSRRRNEGRSDRLIRNLQGGRKKFTCHTTAHYPFGQDCFNTIALFYAIARFPIPLQVQTKATTSDLTAMVTRGLLSILVKALVLDSDSHPIIDQYINSLAMMELTYMLNPSDGDVLLRACAAFLRTPENFETCLWSLLGVVCRVMVLRTGEFNQRASEDELEDFPINARMESTSPTSTSSSRLTGSH